MFQTDEDRAELRRLCVQIGSDSSNTTDAQALKFGAYCAEMVPQMLDRLEELERRDGGKFGEQLRDALSAHILAFADGRAFLRSEVRVLSLNVFVAADGKRLVDVRMEVKGP